MPNTHYQNIEIKWLYLLILLIALINNSCATITQATTTPSADIFTPVLTSPDGSPSGTLPSPTLTPTPVFSTTSWGASPPPPYPTIPSPLPSYTPAPSEISGWVVYSRHIGNGQIELFMAHLDTGEIHQLTHIGYADLPVWSLDGERILFTASEGGPDTNLYLINVDGSNLQRLTDYEGFDGMPDWSPDNRHIVFISDRDGNREIYTLELETREIVRLTYDMATEGEPTWSPDGQHIAFSSNREANLFEIYMMKTDGTEVEQITSDVFGNWRPVWCPDSACLIYEKAPAMRGYISELYLTDLTTEEARLLLTGPYTTAPKVDEWFAARSPVRGYISFSIGNLLHAYDVEDNHLYSLGLQAVDAALFP